MASLDKNITKRGNAVLTVKYNNKEQKYHYWDSETFEGVAGMTALGPVVVGANEEKEGDEKKKPEESSKSSDISNVVSNIEVAADVSGWIKAIRAKYADKNGVLNLDDKKELKPIFIDDKGNFKENIDSKACAKAVNDLKSEASTNKKEFIKEFDNAYKNTKTAIEKDDKKGYTQYIGDKFIQHWTLNNKYGCKFLGMDVNPKDFAKAKVAGLAKKGVEFIENCDWNILSTGPKLALALWKGINFLAAVGSSIAQRLKSAKKIKKEKVNKEVEETLKKIKEAKKNNGIPE